MNFRKLITYLTMGTAAAMPLAVAQNPTILQGSYISNVFGNSNFIKNPNAQTNIADVTVSNATVTRSTTTPLVATSEFLVTVTSANGTIAWNTRTFDQGMKGQNCEARFTYRGFQSTSVAQVRQGATVAGANVVARLALTASTDPRIASINFPCGDLSQPTYFVITDTATLSGTHEIGGAYVGLATNMANVAQAELVGAVKWTATTNCEWLFSNTTSYTSFTADADCTTPAGSNIEGQASAPATKIPAITFSNLKPGRYLITATGRFASGGGSATAGGAMYLAHFRFFDGTNAAKNENTASATRTTGNDGPGVPVITGEFEYTTAQSNLTFQIQGKTNSQSPNSAYAVVNASDQSLYISVYRFPSSSELVVTPERQNVFGGVSYAGNTDFSGTSATVASVTDSNFGARTFHGGASLAGTACGLTANDFGFCMTNVPPGTYQIAGNAEVGSVEAGTDKSWCNYKVRVGGTSLSDTEVINVIPHSNAWNSFTPIGTGIIKITAFQPTLRVWMSYNKDSLADSCNVRSATSALSSALPSLQISPLDQPSNSALYVEGPVKAAATGAAIPAGYVGQRIDSDTIIGTAIGTTVTYADKAGGTDAVLTLPPGTWQIHANFQSLVTSGATLNNFSYVTWSIRNDTDAVTLADTVRITYAKTPAAVAFSNYTPVALSTTVNLTSSKNFKLAGTRIDGAGVGDATLDVAGSWTAQFYAIRLN